jgi:hypothetical protein
MPTETEQLKLIVSLVDDASPGLKNITDQIKEIGGAAVKRAHEAARTEIKTTSELIKRLTGDLGEATKYLTSFRAGLLASGAGLALFGWEMARQIGALKQYADKLKEIQLFSKDLGIDAAEVKNIITQFNHIGVSADKVKDSIKGITERQVELQRFQRGGGGEFWAEMMRFAGPSAESQENMRNMLRLIAEAHTRADLLNRIRKAGASIEEEALARGDPKEKAAADKQLFYDKMHYDSQLEQLATVKELSTAQHDAITQWIKDAQQFADLLNDISATIGSIVEKLKSPILGKDSPLRQDLEDIKKIVDAINTFIDKWQTGEFRKLANEPAKGTRMAPPGTAPGAIEVTPQGKELWNEFMNLFRGGGAADKQSSAIEDNSKKLSELTDLYKLAMFGGGGAGGQGGIVNAAFTQGGGGGPGVGGRGTTPRFGGGGYRQLDGDGDGGGRRGGDGLPLPGRGGGGGRRALARRLGMDRGGAGSTPPGAPSGVGPGAMLAPGGEAPAAFIMHHTSGGGTPSSVVEDWRAHRPGIGTQYIMDREGVIHDVRKEFGYSGTSNIITGSGAGAGLSNRVIVGMEVIARDDKDVTPAQVAAARKFIAERYPNTPIYGHGEVNPGHREASEGMTIVRAIRAERQRMAERNRRQLDDAAAAAKVPGPGEANRTGRFPGRDRQTMDENRRLLDRAARSESVFVKGTGKINVDVNAPYQTALASGGGLFKNTTVNQQLQMLPAQGGQER